MHADLIEVFRIVRGLSSNKLEAFFELGNKRTTRGHQWKLKKKPCNIDLRQHFFSETERVINMSNNLEQHVVSATSMNCFKNRLQKMRQDESTFCQCLSLSDQSTLVAEPGPG